MLTSASHVFDRSLASSAFNMIHMRTGSGGLNSHLGTIDLALHKTFVQLNNYFMPTIEEKREQRKKIKWAFPLAKEFTSQTLQFVTPIIWSRKAVFFQLCML